ncbi:MAG: Xaa-Pro peptidase family protein [Candidatus Omnitrophica bacterium]|nr:Xaa-Pro peptidase family protein [Candidatus Omnitrophota bacterium]
MNEAVRKCIVELKKGGYDAILVSSSINITYLSNFRPSEGYLLVTSEGKLTYFTNFLYEQEAKKTKIWEVVVSNGKNIFNCIADKIRHEKLKRVGFEAKNIAFLEYKKICEILSNKEIKLIPTDDFIEEIRAIKTDDELKKIKKAILISQEAFEYIRTIYQNKMSEKYLCIEIEKFLKTKGDNNVAFPPIVAYDENSSYPHHQSQDKIFAQKHILIDLGARYLNYCADLTRIFLKVTISSLYKKILDIVKYAQDIAIKKIKDGESASDVDLAARNYIENRGYGKYFGHGLGHGIGLDVHEKPFLNPYNKKPLKENMIITIEPAIYLSGNFGIRLEDIVLVKSNKAEILSKKTEYFMMV